MKDILSVIIGGAIIILFVLLYRELVDETCIDSEIQYYNVTCIGEDHKVCETDGMRFYFNMSGENNLTQTQIDSLAEEL